MSKAMRTSFIFSDEEARFLKAVLRWQAHPSPILSPSDLDAHLKDPDRFRHEVEARRGRMSALASRTEEEEEEEKEDELRVLLVGSEECGKTSLLTRFVRGSQPISTPDPTFSRVCRHSLHLINPPNTRRRIVIHALELAAHLPTLQTQSSPVFAPRNSEPFSKAISLTEAAIIVHSARDPHSLSTARRIAHELQRRAPNPYALVLVGSMTDIVDGRNQGGCLAEEINATLSPSAPRCTYFQVSALTGDNVEAVFQHVASLILQARRCRTAHEDEVDGTESRKCNKKLEKKKSSIGAAGWLLRRSSQVTASVLRRGLGGLWRTMTVPWVGHGHRHSRGKEEEGRRCEKEKMLVGEV